VFSKVLTIRITVWNAWVGIHKASYQLFAITIVAGVPYSQSEMPFLSFAVAVMATQMIVRLSQEVL
jgi:hypothetical protein